MTPQYLELRPEATVDEALVVPVVDREQRLVGMVTVDDAMEILEHEETEDVARASASDPAREEHRNGIRR